MANSFPSSGSDESSSEGTLPREFVNETIVQDQRALSPRSALLSHTSRHDPPHDDNDRNPGVLETTRPERRSPSERRKRERDLSKANNSQRELVRLLVDQEREASKLRKALRMAIQRMETESQRATDLERANQSTSEHLRAVNENRLVAEEEANKANRELRVYHVKLENVQKEVDRAQESLKELERQKVEAEAVAARARAQTRKIHQQRMVAAAREEGRRLGFEAGFDHARQERQMMAGSRAARLSLPQSASGSHPARASHRQRAQRRIASTADDDILPSPEMSPSQLPLRNFPDTSHNIGSLPRHTAQGTPLHPFQPPPPSDSESETEREPDPPPHQPNDHPSRSQTPGIQVYSLDIPPTEQIVRDYHANERPTNDNVITTQPREEWVTANEYREIKGTSPPPPPQPQPQLPQPQLQLQPLQFPGPYPPPLPLPTRQPPPLANVRIMPPPPKPVSRLLTLAKSGPASWYRSLSRRKKNKPLIDPVPEDEVAPPASNAAVEPGPSDPDTHFGPPPQPTQSWYQSKQVLGSAPPSVRSQEFPYIKRRPVSAASTQISRFDLLATPNAPPRNGLDGVSERVRENNSLLSVIKEDPSSRGNTPSKDRILGRPTSGDPRRPPPPQPVFDGQNLHQQPSYATMSSVTQNPRRRRGLSIDVPDPNAPLEPAGAAYQRAPGYRAHNRSAASLSRMPSRISEKTTPNTSIGIDVVPPSSMQPEFTQSPPHTGVNHLTPYYAFKPSSQTAREGPSRSQVSLGSNRGAPVPIQEYPMTPGRSVSGPYGNPLAAPRQSREFEHSNRSAAHATPKSTRSRSSRVDGVPWPSSPSPSPNNMNPNNNASQANLTAGPSNPGVRPPIHHIGSSTSVGSYSKYNPDEYNDPAYWGPNGPGDVMTQPRPPSTSGVERHGHPRAPSRASVNSDLSYV